MRPGIFWGDHGCPGVPWGNQTDPLNLVQVIAFTKICYFFLSNQNLQSSRPYK